jgi:tetratricopeptide (TPR) repeat protein
MKRLFLVTAWLFVAGLLPGLVAAQDVKTHVEKGIANCEKGNFDQAMRDFDAGLKLKPNDPVLWDYRGMVYRCKGQNDKAIQDFNKAMELDPKFARAYRNRGMVYFDLGEFDKSLTDLNKAQSLGYKVDEDFLKMVARKAAEKK